MPDIRTDTTGIDQVDVRGPRFAAWLTTVVLAGVIVLSAVSIPAAVALLAAQAVAFAIGATRGPRRPVRLRRRGGSDMGADGRAAVSSGIREG